MFIIIILGLMLGGMLIGYLALDKPLDYIRPIITVLICVLLFLLGIEVGRNETLIQHFHRIGIEALVITIVAVLGSALAAWILWLIIVKRTKKK